LRVLKAAKREDELFFSHGSLSLPLRPRISLGLDSCSVFMRLTLKVRSRALVFELIQNSFDCLTPLCYVDCDRWSSEFYPYCKACGRSSR